MTYSQPSEVKFTGIQFRIDTPLSPDMFLAQLRELTGKASVADIIEVCKTLPMKQPREMK
jgi:hypothetical protein